MNTGNCVGVSTSGLCDALVRNSTQSPVSKLIALQEVFARQLLRQSVNWTIPGILSSVSI